MNWARASYLSSGSGLMLITSVSSQTPPSWASSAYLARSLVWVTGQRLASTRPEAQSEARGEAENRAGRGRYSTWGHMVTACHMSHMMLASMLGGRRSSVSSVRDTGIKGVVKPMTTLWPG